MTCSGKTGLGLIVIEEAAIDGIPVLAIDPKGDLSNLLLTFPDLTPAQFAPWVDLSDTARRALTEDAFAAQQAEAWRAGLAEWDQDASRIARLRAAADVTVYTPGSRAGVPLALRSRLPPLWTTRTPPRHGSPRPRGTAANQSILPWLIHAVQKPPSTTGTRRN
jgi:hypothetical protein